MTDYETGLQDGDDSGVDLPVLTLKPHEERRLQAGHLWIFSNEIDVAATPLTRFEPGTHVQVRSSGGKFMGYAYVNPRTLISARLLGREEAHPPGRSLLVYRLRVALSLRERLGRGPSTAWSTASRTCCPAWSWTATTTCWWCRSARPAWRRSRTTSSPRWSRW